MFTCLGLKINGKHINTLSHIPINVIDNLEELYAKFTAIVNVHCFSKNSKLKKLYVESSTINDIGSISNCMYLTELS